MPGKVNPVIPEMVIQVAAYVCGQAVAVTIGGQNGPLELNMMHPLIAYETLERHGAAGQRLRRPRRPLRVGDRGRRRALSRYWIEWSLALVTPLATRIGYDRAAALAYRAFKEKRTVREVALEEKVLAADELERLLDPATMTGSGGVPGVPGAPRKETR